MKHFELHFISDKINGLIEIHNTDFALSESQEIIEFKNLEDIIDYLSEYGRFQGPEDIDVLWYLLKNEHINDVEFLEILDRLN